MTLLEKNELVGGRMQSYNPPEAPGYRFDTGPSLLLFPEVYKEVRSVPAAAAGQVDSWPNRRP